MPAPLRARSSSREMARSPRARGLWASDRYTRHLPPALDPPHQRRVPGFLKCSSATAEATQHPAGQARGGLSRAARPRPPNSRPFVGGRPPPPAERWEPARGGGAFAILGTGSQLLRAAQKERRLRVRHTLALQKWTQPQSLSSTTECSEGRRNTRSPSSASGFRVK